MAMKAWHVGLAVALVSQTIGSTGSYQWSERLKNEGLVKTGALPMNDKEIATIAPSTSEGILMGIGFVSSFVGCLIMTIGKNRSPAWSLLFLMAYLGTLILYFLKHGEPENLTLLRKST